MALTAKQVYALARQAGWSESDAITATAIAYYESGWDPGAHNPNAATGDNSYGLWQINMLGAMGPARRAQFGISSNDQLYDPATNARAAYAVYKQQGWNAWSVYRHGKHRGKVGEVARAVGGADWRDWLRSIGNVALPGDPFGKGPGVGDLAGEAAAGAGERIVASIWDRVGAKVLFVGLALGLVGWGAFQTFRPQLRAVADRAAQLGGAAVGVATKGAA